MGRSISRLLSRITGKSEIRILVLGLDCAGKTTLLPHLKLGESEWTNPTMGFFVETIKYKNICFTCWDLGIRDKIRPLWRTYFDNVEAIIYVIDSNDELRLREAADELDLMLEEEKLKDSVLLVLANKQDLPHAISVPEIAEKICLNSLQRAWHIQSTCGMKGEGLYEGFDWLTNELAKKL